MRAISVISCTQIDCVPCLVSCLDTQHRLVNVRHLPCVPLADSVYDSQKDGPKPRIQPRKQILAGADPTSKDNLTTRGAVSTASSASTREIYGPSTAANLQRKSDTTEQRVRTERVGSTVGRRSGKCKATFADRYCVFSATLWAVRQTIRIMDQLCVYYSTQKCE